MKKIFVMMLAATTFVSCTKDSDYPAANSGSLSLQTTTVTVLGNITRADGGQVNLSDLGYTATPIERVLVTCIDESSSFNRAFESPDSYNHDYNTPLEPGRYLVTIGSQKPLPDYTTPDGKTIEKLKAPYYTGDRSALIPQCTEGENLPYFEGTAEVEVVAGETKPVTVTLEVANTVVCVKFTDTFKNYFDNGAEITLKSKNGFTRTISYTHENKTVAEQYFYVRPQEFTLSGTAMRQDPSPGIIEAKPVELSYTEKNPAKRTLYTIEEDVELNPNA